MFTLAFWKAAAERAAKTAGQVGLLVAGADLVNALDFDWLRLLGFMLGGAVLSLITSLASAKVGYAGPSLVGETLTDTVAAEASPKSPTGAVAGPAADVPEGRPVDVTESTALNREGI